MGVPSPKVPHRRNNQTKTVSSSIPNKNILKEKKSEQLLKNRLKKILNNDNDASTSFQNAKDIPKTSSDYNYNIGVKKFVLKTPTESEEFFKKRTSNVKNQPSHIMKKQTISKDKFKPKTESKLKPKTESSKETNLKPKSESSKEIKLKPKTESSKEIKLKPKIASSKERKLKITQTKDIGKNDLNKNKNKNNINNAIKVDDNMQACSNRTVKKAVKSNTQGIKNKVRIACDKIENKTINGPKKILKTTKKSKVGKAKKSKEVASKQNFSKNQESSDSENSSYIDKFFDDIKSGCGLTDEDDCDESESIYEDESDYNDLTDTATPSDNDNEDESSHSNDQLLYPQETIEDDDDNDDSTIKNTSSEDNYSDKSWKIDDLEMPPETQSDDDGNTKQVSGNECKAIANYKNYDDLSTSSEDDDYSPSKDSCSISDDYSDYSNCSLDEEELSIEEISSDYDESYFDYYHDDDEDDDDDSSDEDYQLPEGVEEDVFIRRGDAKIYDIHDNNISFGSDSPQIIEIKDNDANLKEKQKSEFSGLLAESGEKSEENSDNSCPKLVPITYNDDVYVDIDDDDGDEDEDDFVDEFYDEISEDSNMELYKTCLEIESEGDETELEPKIDHSDYRKNNSKPLNDTKKTDNTINLNKKINIFQKSNQTSQCKLITTDGNQMIVLNIGQTDNKNETKGISKTKNIKKQKDKKTVSIEKLPSKTKKKSKKRKADESIDEDCSDVKVKNRKLSSSSYVNLEKDTCKNILIGKEKDYEKEENIVVKNRSTNNLKSIKIEKINASKKIGKQSMVNNTNCIKEKNLEVENKSGIDTKSLFYNSFNSRYVLIILKDTIFFHGTLKLKLVLGSAEILGYNLQKNEKFQAFSPRGYSFLYIKPITINHKSVDEHDIEKELSNFSNDFIKYDLAEIREKFDKNNDSIILLERNDSEKKIQMVRRYMKENIFPNMRGLNIDSSRYISEFILHCMFYSQCNNNIRINSEWNSIKLTNESKLAVIGGKGVGKSTLNRYLINKNLSKYKKILLIDFDIGQSEMFLPQTISATLIDKPILGPGYFYTTTPEKSFLYGNINIVLSPSQYMKNVVKLLEFCYKNNEFNGIPWIINTMGYTQGFGSELIAAILSNLKPTHIIQIQSKNKTNNFEYIMTSDKLKSIQTSIFMNEWMKGKSDLKYEFTLLQSMAKGRRPGVFDMTPKDNRFCMIMTRLGTIIKEQHDWLTDVKPYSASFDDVDIISFSEHDMDKESLLDVINANLVYVCKKINNSETIECFGIGIVRGVDKMQKRIYLISSLTPENLSNVNALAVCNIPLPTSILLNQGSKVKGTIPYTYSTNDFPMSKHVYQYNSSQIFQVDKTQQKRN